MSESAAPATPAEIAAAIYAHLANEGEVAGFTIEAVEQLGDHVALIIGGRIFGITVAGGDKAEGA